MTGMSQPPLIHSPVTRAMIEYTGLHGVDKEAICSAAGIPLRALAQSDSRFTPDQLTAVWTRASEALDDPYIGLHVGAFVQLSALGVVGYLLQSSSSLAAAVECASRYTSLAGNVLNLSHRTERNAWHLTFRLQQPVPRGASFVLSQITDASMSIVGRALGTLSNRDVRPLHVRFAHAKPPEVAEYERIFKTRPEFGRDENALIYDRGVRDLAVTFSNPQIHQLFERHAIALLKVLEEQDDLTGKVKMIIVDHIRDEDLSAKQVAEALFMSPRTLQRKLAREGTTFRDLVDEVRCDLACDYLVRLGTSVTDTALLVGLSGPSAFVRSFKRWTGYSPKDYQSRQLAGRASTLTASGGQESGS